MASPSSISPLILPVAGGDMDAEPITNAINNLYTWGSDGSNFDEGNADLTGADGLVGKSTAQTLTGLKTFSADAAGAGGIRTARTISHTTSSGTATDADGVAETWTGEDDGGNAQTYGKLSVKFTDVSNGTEKGQWVWSVADGTDGSVDDVAALDISSFSPTTNDGIALGTTALGWSDLHLATGGVINWANGEVTITETDANTVTVAGATTWDMGAVATLDFDGATAFTNGAGAFTFTPTTDTLFANGTGVVVGHPAQISVAGVTPEFQVLGTGFADSYAVIGQWVASTEGPALNLVKSRNAAIGSFTIVQNGDDLGSIRAWGDDGVDNASEAARIRFEVDGVPGVGDMPGRITLETTADGAETPTEAVRIDSSQNVGVGVSAFGTNATNVIGITADGTVPASSPAGMIQIFADDSSDGATNATLAIRTEQSVEAIGTFTASHKLKIWINGTEYWIQLDAV